MPPMEQTSPPAERVARLVEAVSPVLAQVFLLVERLVLVAPVFPRSE